MCQKVAMPLDEPPQRPDRPFPPELPDPEPMFRAIRAHLRQAHAEGFLEFDQTEGLYVVVDPSLEKLREAVARRMAWEMKERHDVQGVAGRTDVVITNAPMRKADPARLLEAARKHLHEAGALAAAIPSDGRDFWVAAGPSIEDVMEALMESKRSMRDDYTGE